MTELHRPDSDIIQLAETGSAAETLEWYRRKIDSSLYFFNKAVLGYPDLTPSLHQPLCQFLVDTIPKRGRGILMPRKFFKSTNVKGYVLWRLRNDTNLRILFVGENDKVGSKNLKDIQWNIQNNRLLQALYPHLIPRDYAQTKWTETEILLPRSKTFDEPTITSIGIGAKHTGFHYDLIVYDDPIGLEAAGSPADMQKAIDWFQAAPGLLNSPDSEELIVGTRWKEGVGDLYGYVMENLPFRETTAGGVEGFLWYSRSAIEDGRSIFPEKYPLHELEKIRKRTGPYLWAANYMNDPTISGNVDFPGEWVQTYAITADGRGIELPVPLDAKPGTVPEIVSLSSLVRVSFWDPSAGGISAGAENAIVVLGMDHKRRIFGLEVWSKNCGFAEAIEKWHQLNDKWHCWRNYFEAVGAHKEAGEMIRMRPNECLYCKKTHEKLKAIPVNPDSRSKEDRIRALAQVPFEERRVYLRMGVMEKLRRQITTFPHSPMVDLFDAFAYGISLLRAPSGTSDEIETQHREQEAARAAARPRSHTGRSYGGYV